MLGGAGMALQCPFVHDCHPAGDGLPDVGAGYLEGFPLAQATGESRHLGHIVTRFILLDDYPKLHNIISLTEETEIRNVRIGEDANHLHARRTYCSAARAIGPFSARRTEATS